jgi:predicted NUDIX family NTP pyrophosphohydrolase
VWVSVALSGSLEPLGEIRQRGGKRVIAFAVEGDLDVQRPTDGQRAAKVRQ